jgi:hypothetical protein
MDLLPEYYSDVRFDFEAMWAFMLRVILADGRNGVALTWEDMRGAPKFDTTLGLIRKRAQLRRYHPFNVPKFVALRALHKLAEWRSRFRAGSSGAVLPPPLPDLPTDIAAAVDCLMRRLAEQRPRNPSPEHQSLPI